MEDKAWLHTLNKLDSFGVSYNFQINSKDKFKTTLGAMFTLIYYLVILILFLQLGEEVYKRKKPKVSLNTDIQSYEEVSLLNINFIVNSNKFNNFNNFNNIDSKIKIGKEWETILKSNNLANIKSKNQTDVKKFSSSTDQYNFPTRKYVRIFYMDYFIDKYF